jgi:alpha-galactosidase
MKLLRRLSISIFLTVVLPAVMLAASKAGRSTHAEQLETAHESSSAPTPPMGWNSYDSYGGSVTEQQVLANASYMAAHLAQYGWKYVVIDYYWYFPYPVEHGDPASWAVSMDEYGRLLPALNRFPSSAHGKGFKPLADYIHSLGLKFGIHIMRGIPRAAVRDNLPILGTHDRAPDVAELNNTCAWSTAMYGVDVSNPAGQAYYDSIARLYASWGVDFIKADDMSRGENPAGETYHAVEIEALSKAIKKTGRPMVLSLSPGPAPLTEAAHLERWSQMWRISDDIWDDWKQVLHQFDLCREWAGHSGPGHWPDADMLPLGWLHLEFFGDEPRASRLTHNEQITLMTLWSIFRSPLMMGGNLTTLDPFTLSLLTNNEVIAVDQTSTGSHELFHHGDQIAWAASVPHSRAEYLALFNTGEKPEFVQAEWQELGLKGHCQVRDLWKKKDLGEFFGHFAATIAPHGAGLYKITPVR